MSFLGDRQSRQTPVIECNWDLTTVTCCRSAMRRRTDGLEAAHKTEEQATGGTKATYTAITWLLIAYCTSSASFSAFNISLVLYL